MVGVTSTPRFDEYIEPWALEFNPFGVHTLRGRPSRAVCATTDFSAKLAEIGFWFIVSRGILRARNDKSVPFSPLHLLNLEVHRSGQVIRQSHAIGADRSNVP